MRERGTPVVRLVLTPSAFEPNSGAESILVQARRLGLTINRLPSLDESGKALQLAPVAVEDLLLRPSVKIDYGRLREFLKGKSVVVTGGGGSIGAEICDRVVTFGAERLLIVENSEPRSTPCRRRWRPSRPRPGSKGVSRTFATAGASCGC